MKIRTTMLIAFAAFVIALTGCTTDNRFDNPRTSPQTTRTTEASGTSFLLDASAFDLETVIALVQDGEFEDIAALEKKINDPETGINNVDIDGDGKIDFIAVEETQKDGKYTLSFIAYPSSAPDNEAGYTAVAELSIEQNTTTQDVEISGGYPDYVSGYDSHYYHTSHHYMTGSAVGDVLFYSWLFSPSRSVYYGHGWGYYDSWYGGGYYSYSRPVQSVTVINTTRSTYSTSSGLSSSKSTVTSSARPSSYTTTSSKSTTSTYAKSSRSSSSSSKSTSTASSSSSSSSKSTTTSSSRSSGSSTKSSGSSSSSRSSGSARSSGSSSRSRGSSRGGK